jgi:hypothetical protein
VGIVQWQNARLWLWMSWVRPPLPTPILNQLESHACRLRAVKCQTCHFAARLDNFVRHNVPVCVHCGPMSIRSSASSPITLTGKPEITNPLNAGPLCSANKQLCFTNTEPAERRVLLCSGRAYSGSAEGCRGVVSPSEMGPVLGRTKYASRIASEIACYRQ